MLSHQALEDNIYHFFCAADVLRVSLRETHRRWPSSFQPTSILSSQSQRWSNFLLPIPITQLKSRSRSSWGPFNLAFAIIPALEPKLLVGSKVCHCLELFITNFILKQWRLVSKAKFKTPLVVGTILQRWPHVSARWCKLVRPVRLSGWPCNKFYRRPRCFKLLKITTCKQSPASRKVIASATSPLCRPSQPPQRLAAPTHPHTPLPPLPCTAKTRSPSPPPPLATAILRCHSKGYTH